MVARTLDKHELREFTAKLEAEGFPPCNKKDTVMEVKEDLTYYKINNRVDFFLREERVYPTIKSVLRTPFLKKVTVDMGAVKFVVSGADVMRPGIVEIENEIRKDEIVAVIDVNNRKTLAVGTALLDGESMKAASKGKCIKNVHYIGDEMWNID